DGVGAPRSPLFSRRRNRRRLGGDSKTLERLLQTPAAVQERVRVAENAHGEIRGDPRADARNCEQLADRLVELCSRVECELAGCDLAGQDVDRAGAHLVDIEIGWIDSSADAHGRGTGP